MEQEILFSCLYQLILHEPANNVQTKKIVYILPLQFSISYKTISSDGVIFLGDFILRGHKILLPRLVLIKLLSKEEKLLDTKKLIM